MYSIMEKNDVLRGGVVEVSKEVPSSPLLGKKRNLKV